MERSKDQIIEDLNKHGLTKKNKPLITNLMLNGPPHKDRKLIWLETSGARLQMKTNPNYYSAIVEDKLKIKTEFSQQIDRDLHRTFPAESYFVEEKHLTSLRKILVAYSWRNPTVGYCQGLNFLVGRLLTVGFSEEECFWLLAQIIEAYLPNDYFSVMTGVIIDQQVFQVLLKNKLPKMAKHLSSIGIDASLYTVHWLVCMFAYTFPKNVVMRIWDIFFIEGSVFLFKIGLSLMWIFRKEITKITDFNEAFRFLEFQSQNIADPDIILGLAISMKSINSKTIDKLREKLRIQSQDETTCNDSVSTEDSAKSYTEICTDESECELKSKQECSYFTFRSTSGVSIIDEYINDSNVPKVVDLANTIDNDKNLVIGCKNHACPIKQSSSVIRGDIEEAYNGLRNDQNEIS
ncbi:unnamed protein product [Blepharisma stoltei]|uniref:Rab-GAP TBC domain-containing protein n=1 Tax=Blepharisma stoltei TaxID=1481888 RepID=A0AAU9K643_9CILI|nr:unnamed protein product [Blepharisma stoltei]